MSASPDNPPDPQSPPLEPPPEAPTAPRSAMFIVFLVVFIDLLGFGIVLPLLPRYAADYLPPDLSGPAAGFVIGILISSFSAMQFLFAPLWGRVSDRVGRKPILLIGLAGSVVFYALFGFASELDPQTAGTLALTLIFLSRIGAGISGATISTAAAVIADCTTRENRARGMALIGAAFGIGFTFGPLIAWLGLEVFQHYRGGPGYIAAVLSLGALILGIRLLPETRRPGRPSERRSWLDLHGLYSTLRTPTVGLLVFTFFLATFAFANFEGTLSMLTKEAFNYQNEDMYLIFAYVGFMLMLAQGAVYRPLAKRVGEVPFIRAGALLMCLGLCGVAVVGASASTGSTGLLVWFFLALACSVFGFAFLNPSVQGLVSKRSDPTRQGEVLGVNQSFSALARILGPVIGMTLFGLTASHVLPYITASALLAVVFLLTWKVRGGH